MLTSAGLEHMKRLFETGLPWWHSINGNGVIFRSAPDNLYGERKTVTTTLFWILQPSTALVYQPLGTNSSGKCSDYVNIACMHFSEDVISSIKGCPGLHIVFLVPCTKALNPVWEP